MPDETDVKPAMTARKLSVSDIINRLGQKEVAQELEEKIREGTKNAAFRAVCQKVESATGHKVILAP